MQPVQKYLNAMLLATLSSHIFCCVIPTFVSLAGLVTGLGFLTISPVVEEFHHHMHDYELPILLFSFVMLCAGWGVERYSQRLHAPCCHGTGCDHAPCTSKKRRAHVILIIATLLFLVNLAVYYGDNFL